MAERIISGLTAAVQQFKNSESNRMARRTDYNTGECRMKETSASCFHYPTRFNREWAAVNDASLEELVFDGDIEESTILSDTEEAIKKLLSDVKEISKNLDTAVSDGYVTTFDAHIVAEIKETLKSLQCEVESHLNW